jgi:[ribosomal protein S18]-alanine N-acetyltransferase
VGEAATITIAPMMKEDIEQVLAIERACFSQPWSRNLFLSEFRSSSVSTLLVALSGDPAFRQVVGYIVYWKVEDEMHILNLAVLPVFRRRGISRMLVLSGIRRAAKKGVSRAFLEVRVSNDAAQKLYSALGFTGSFVRRSYYDEPVEDAVIMTLEGGAFQALKNEVNQK